MCWGRWGRWPAAASAAAHDLVPATTLLGAVGPAPASHPAAPSRMGPHGGGMGVLQEVLLRWLPFLLMSQSHTASACGLLVVADNTADCQYL